MNSRSSVRSVRLRRGLRRGFNLIELLIALAISAALLTATMVALDASFMAYENTTALANTHTVARLSMNRILTMIRTGQEFGPFPINPQDNLLASDEIEFTTTNGDVMTIRWVDSDPAFERDNALYIMVGGNSYLLLEGVLPQYDPPDSTDDADRIRPFTLEYELGFNLHRATIDLLIQPDASLGTSIDTASNAQRLHLVASAMPRVEAY